MYVLFICDCVCVWCVYSLYIYGVIYMCLCCVWGDYIDIGATSAALHANQVCFVFFPLSLSIQILI